MEESDAKQVVGEAGEEAGDHLRVLVVVGGHLAPAGPLALGSRLAEDLVTPGNIWG